MKEMMMKRSMKNNGPSKTKIFEAMIIDKNICRKAKIIFN